MDFALKWLPLALRLLVVILLLWELGRLLTPGFISSIDLRARLTQTEFAILALAQALVLLALSLGAGGRIAAIIGLCSLGVQQMFASLSPAQIFLVILYTSILYLGTGLFSLWKPEDRLFMHRAGEQAS